MPTERDTARWIAVVGAGRDGRADVLAELAAALVDAGARVGGFLQETRWSGDTIEGYDLVHPTTRERVPLAREDHGVPELCRWTFSDAAFEAARRWTLEGDPDVVFVEAGRLEAAERGHWPTVARALAIQPLTILSIRRGVLASVALRLPDPIDAIELPAGDHEVEGFVARSRRHYEERKP